MEEVEQGIRAFALEKRKPTVRIWWPEVRETMCEDGKA